MGIAPTQQERFRWLPEKARDNADNWKKVRDHCHFTGKFRGAAHSWCNLQTKSKFKIPVVLHNFRGYDSHLIMRSGHFGNYKRIGCIANNLEKYMCINLNSHIRFLDSLQFLDEKLETLIDMRYEIIQQHYRDHADDSSSNETEVIANVFPLLSAEFPDINHRQMLLRKGVYPYEWVKDWECFNKKHLPPLNDFRSSLRGNEAISHADYNHAQRVWTEFQMKTFGEYHDLYLRSDVVLLADVFEAFRKMCMDEHGIDPAHCLSAPNLSWHCMLKYTGVSLELLTDPDMYEMIQGGLRGGMCFVSKRYAKAQNPYTDPTRSIDDPTNTWIVYLDANNLYGAAMSMKLPHANFEWLPDYEVKTMFLKWVVDVNAKVELGDRTGHLAFDEEKLKAWLDKQNKEQDKGYILEVDFEYPDEIHDLMSDYPVGVERRCVNEDELSQMQLNLAAANGLTKCSTKDMPKLLGTLHPKQNYVVHYMNLKLFVQLGVRVTQVHRILSFTQTNWLAPYIDMNTRKRQASKNSFVKKLVKLLNNSIYGKCVENVLKRRSIYLCNTRRKAKRKCDDPLLKSIRIFSENLVAVEMQKPTVLISKPTAVGFSVLELSKYIMFDFHYNVMKKRYGDRVNLIFTDTDSLTYEVETANVYADMREMHEHFDLSEYPRESPYYSDENKMVVGKMKDELKGKIAQEVTACAPKMYAFLMTDKTEKKTAKGVLTSALKNTRYAAYFKQIFEPAPMFVDACTIRSNLHDLHTVHKRKHGLSSFDNKRFIMSDGVRTLAFGHHSLRNLPIHADYPPRADGADECCEEEDKDDK